MMFFEDWGSSRVDGDCTNQIALTNGGTYRAETSVNRSFTYSLSGGRFDVASGVILELSGTLNGTNFTKIGDGTLLLSGSSPASQPVP